MKSLMLSLLLILNVNLFSQENSYNNSAHIGMISDNPNSSMFGTIGVTKQYIFNDFMIGMDFNVLLFGQENFEDFSGLNLSPKLGMIFIGDDKKDFYSAIFVTSGISAIMSENQNAMGYSGGIGLETRYLNYGFNFGYITNINRALNFEGLKLSLHYWF